MGKGSVLFPDLGEHCRHEDCHQLDFLPFTCDGCHQVFCLEHRTYKAHCCPKSEHNSRIVAVCEICSMSIEKKSDEADDTIFALHEKSGDCDPKKKQKPKCPVRRCKELLTFCNTSTCNKCSLKVCLKHRFPSDHACTRNVMSCRDSKQNISARTPSIKAC